MKTNFFKKILTALVLFTSLIACSTSDDSNDTKTNSHNNSGCDDFYITTAVFDVILLDPVTGKNLIEEKVITLEDIEIKGPKYLNLGSFNHYEKGRGLQLTLNIDYKGKDKTFEFIIKQKSAFKLHFETSVIPIENCDKVLDFPDHQTFKVIDSKGKTIDKTDYYYIVNL